MTSYPVRYLVERPERFTRLQLAIRLVAFCALGILGATFGTVFLFAYLALPVFAASRLAGAGSDADYVRDDGPRIVRALSWFAAVAAWAGLIAERLPARSAREVVAIEVDSEVRPTSRSAIWRVVTGLPSALVLGLLGFVGLFVWGWAALTILVTERVGDHAYRYLVGLQRWSIRLLAYQASLVDEYPPFSFANVPPQNLPTAHLVS